MTNQAWSVKMADNVLAELRSKFQDSRALSLAWHYETGCIAKALEHVWLKTGDQRYYQSIIDIMDALVEPDGKIKGYQIEEYNLDQINPGKNLFLLYRMTKEDRYLKALSLLRVQMKGHPRTSENGFWHKKIYPYQMWLDGIYMAGPFLAEYAQTFNEPELFDEVARQILLIEKHTRDPLTGLLYHGWDESKEQKWADPRTGCSPHFWSRAMGWYVMAIVDVLDYLPVDHVKRGEIIGIFERIITALVRFQEPASGLWYQILDQGGRKGNYLEASGSCMFIYAILKGVRLGYLSHNLKEPAQKGYQGVIDNLLEEAPGYIKLKNICGCAGLGGNPYRDGSFEYYINEPVKENDYKGVAPFIMASVEMEKL